MIEIEALEGGAEQPVQFAALYTEFAPRVRALASRRTGDAAADDVVQETFLRAFRAYGRYVDEGKTWPWLRQIAERVCIDLHRRQRSEPVATLDGAECDLTFSGVVAREQRDAVAHILAGLSPRQQRVLVLRELGGWSNHAIAAEHDMTIEGVKATLKRARSAFRAAYVARNGGIAVVGPILTGAAAARRSLRRLWEALKPSAPAQAVLASIATVVALSIVGGAGEPAQGDLPSLGDGEAGPALAAIATPLSPRNVLEPAAHGAADQSTSPGPGVDGAAGTVAAGGAGSPSGGPPSDAPAPTTPGPLDVVPQLPRPPKVTDDDKVCRGVSTPGRGGGGTYVCTQEGVDREYVNYVLWNGPPAPVAGTVPTWEQNMDTVESTSGVETDEPVDPATEAAAGVTWTEPAGAVTSAAGSTT